MDRKTKTVLKGFRYRNCDDFAAYLNHMARCDRHPFTEDDIAAIIEVFGLR